MEPTAKTTAYFWVGMVIVIAALAACGAIGVGHPQGVLRQAFARRAAVLEQRLRFIRAGVSGRLVAGLQAAAIGAAVVLAILSGDATFLLVLPLAVLGPDLYLQRAREKRIAAIEAQLDEWMLTLANALKATPSLGDAIASSSELVGGRIGEELDVALKETRLGAPLDTALLNLSRHLRSRLVSSALAALLVARQTGGGLVDVLEQTAASLREMARLEGVLRAKTSESRAQAYVLLAMPFVVIAAITQLDPDWMTPLTDTTVGLLVTGSAVTLWLGAVLMARTILAVDL